MRKRKRKLKAKAVCEQTALEGKQPLTAFEVCARKVRHVRRCSCCLHCGECAIAGAPCSRLGAYVAALEIAKLPLLNDSLRAVCNYSVCVKTCAPIEKEADAGAVWALKIHVRAYVCGGKRQVRKKRRIALYGDEDSETLLIECLSAYINLVEGIKAK